MRVDRLTNQLQLALSDAQSLALGRDHSYLEPLHLLSALLDQQVAVYVLYLCRRVLMFQCCAMN